MRAPAKIYMRKNTPLRKDAPACLPEKFANPDAGFYAITGLQGIAGITGKEKGKEKGEREAGTAHARLP